MDWGFAFMTQYESDFDTDHASLLGRYLRTAGFAPWQKKWQELEAYFANPTETRSRLTYIRFRPKLFAEGQQGLDGLEYLERISREVRKRPFAGVMVSLDESILRIKDGPKRVLAASDVVHNFNQPSPSFYDTLKMYQRSQLNGSMPTFRVPTLTADLLREVRTFLGCKGVRAHLAPNKVSKVNGYEVSYEEYAGALSVDQSNLSITPSDKEHTNALLMKWIEWQKQLGTFKITVI